MIMATVIDSLLKRPPSKPKTAVSTYAGKGKNAVHQVDLLFLPTDPITGAKYALTVIDLGTSAVAARPLKTKTSAAVLAALQNIYAIDPNLKQPLRFEVDAGTEFAGAKAWLRAQKVTVRVALPGRHTQQRAVENLNLALGKAIARRQLSEELLTDRPSRQWVADLAPMVVAINTKWLRAPIAPVDGLTPAADKGMAQYEIGDRVRVQLDRPQDFSGKTLAAGQGKTGFRSGDMRWDPVVRPVIRIYWKPGQTTRYGVEGIGNVAYAPWQLQRLTGKQSFPLAAEVVRGKQTSFIPLELHDKRQANGRVEFLVEWRGFPLPGDYSWQTRVELVKSTEGARLVRSYGR